MGEFVAGSLRLHLGSGNYLWPGWVNVDLSGSDMDCDVTKLPLSDGVAKEIQGIHLFEHLDRMEANNILREWFRVLAPGGKLVLELPCMDKICKLYEAGERNVRYIQFGIFGDPRYRRPEMLHKWCWSQDELKEELQNAGFSRVEFEEPKFHVPLRDMRATAYKG